MCRLCTSRLYGPRDAHPCCIYWYEERDLNHCPSCRVSAARASEWLVTKARRFRARNR